MYKTQYKNVNEIGETEAWKIAKELDPSLCSADPEDPEYLKEALTSLARRIRELESNGR